MDNFSQAYTDAPAFGPVGAADSKTFTIGQSVNVTHRGRAEITTKVLPGIWGVNFVDLSGFGYVFEVEMSA